MPGPSHSCPAPGGKGKKRYGLVGRNIGYSLSPMMHKACYGRFGIDAEYDIIDMEIDPGSAEETLKAMVRERGLAGFNVTTPYKVLVRDLLEWYPHGELDRSASLAGAVNTVELNGEMWKGHSTDGEGFYRSLRKDLGLDPAGKDIVILGAGGAGRSISMYLADLNEARPGRIFVYDVDPDKLAGLISLATERAFDIIEAVTTEAELKELLGSARARLLVNATPAGTAPDDGPPVEPGWLGGSIAVYDLVYARETVLVKEALRKELPAVGGKGMLAAQGAVAFNIWLGVDVESALRCMEEALPVAGI